ITFVLDSQISVVADFISHQISSSWGVAIFICFAIIFIVGQIFILDYVKQINKGTSRAKEFQWSITHIIVTIAQFILAAIVVFVILQVLITQQYNLLTLFFSYAISYGLWVVILALLARSFFSWYKR